MFIGRVTASVWSTVKWPGLEGLKLLLVRPLCEADLGRDIHGTLDPSTENQGVVAVDTVDAGIGDTVIVAYGHAARLALNPDLEPGDPPPHPIDAALVAIVDRIEVYQEA